MDKETQLEEIAQRIAVCKNCPLYKTAINPVPGNGTVNAELLFIGEAPGFWEDQKGIPFCGAAGKLLDELLASIGLDRNQVFVANVLKHRPPNNRDPLPEEIVACQGFLDEQITLIAPKAIITLGRFAMNKFLPEAKISRDRGIGRVVDYQGQKLVIIPMFHPAAALRGATVEGQLREDFKKIPAEVTRLQKLMNGIVEEEKPEEPEEPVKAKSDQLSLV